VVGKLTPIKEATSAGLGRMKFYPPKKEIGVVLRWNILSATFEQLFQ
jgi:hypothetical protein